MLIDCDTCAGRGRACAGCLVNALVEAPAGMPGPDAAEERAIEVFTQAGFDVEVLARTPADPPVPLAGRRRRRRVA